MIAEAIGKNIKALLKEKGITYEKFSEMIGVAPITVTKWVGSGNAGKMKVDMLYRIAETLGTTVDELVREEPECTDDAKSAEKS